MTSKKVSCFSDSILIGEAVKSNFKLKYPNYGEDEPLCISMYNSLLSIDQLSIIQEQNSQFLQQVTFHP
jgi:hypothetical protein